MPRVLALSSQRLSRYHYHWFWGLCMDLQNQPSLNDDATRLKANPQRLEKIIQQLSYLQNQHQIIVLFYWIFNIHQYRENYYQFYSYMCLELYHQGICMLTENQQKLVESIGCFVILSNLEVVLSKFWQSDYTQSVLLNLEWFSARLDSIQAINTDEIEINFISDLIQTTSNASNTDDLDLTLDINELEKTQKILLSDVEHYFLVTASMIAALKILGLPASEGNKLSFNTLKAFYRKRLLASHPDKTRLNTENNFHEVRRALQTILLEVSNPSCPLSNSENYNDFIFNFTFRELFSIFNAKNVTIKSLLEQELEILKQYKADIGASIEKRDKIIRLQQKLLAEGEQYCAKVDRFMKRVDQLTQETLEVENVLNALENKQLSRRQVSILFKAANHFGGLTKLPYYDPNKPNPKRFFETFPDTISEVDENTIMSLEI